MSVFRPIFSAVCLSFAALSSPPTQAQDVLEIGLTTHLGDKQTFNAGDEIRFLITANRPAFVVAIYQDAEGALWQLMPSKMFPSNKIAAGLYMPFPSAQDPVRLVAQPPKGTEAVWLLAAESPFPELAGTTGPAKLKRFKENAPEQVFAEFRLHMAVPVVYAVARFSVQ